MQVFRFIPTIGDGRYLGDRRFDSEGQRRMATHLTLACNFSLMNFGSG